MRRSCYQNSRRSLAKRQASQLVFLLLVISGAPYQGYAKGSAKQSTQLPQETVIKAVQGGNGCQSGSEAYISDLGESLVWLPGHMSATSGPKVSAQKTRNFCQITFNLDGKVKKKRVAYAISTVLAGSNNEKEATYSSQITIYSTKEPTLLDIKKMVSEPGQLKQTWDQTFNPITLVPCNSSSEKLNFKLSLVAKRKKSASIELDGPVTLKTRWESCTQ